MHYIHTAFVYCHIVEIQGLTKKTLKKYAKQDVKRRIQTGMRKSLLRRETLSDTHYLSGIWKGVYTQRGSNTEMNCMLIIDKQGNVAGCGQDISNYRISGTLRDDGRFKFVKQYEGPSYYHHVNYNGILEWRDQLVIRGKWTIEHTSDGFMLMAPDIGLEGAVLSLCNCSAQEVVGMDYQHKKRKIIGEISEIASGVKEEELFQFSDNELINIAEAICTDEDYN